MPPAAERFGWRTATARRSLEEAGRSTTNFSLDFNRQVKITRRNRLPSTSRIGLGIGLRHWKQAAAGGASRLLKSAFKRRHQVPASSAGLVWKRLARCGD